MSSIGSLNETDLHEQLKHLYAGSDGLTEATIEGFIIDVVRGDELVEVQTSGLGKLRRKIEGLSGRYRLRIVYPVASRTRLVKMSDSGEVLSKRRSPKRGRLESIFRELTSIADLLPNPYVTVEIVLLYAIERRVADGRGSWRRRGVSIVGRAIEEIVETAALRTSADYLALLPDLAEPFTNKDLAAASGLDYRTVQPMTSCFRKMGLIEIADKKGSVLLYRFA